MSTDLIKVTEKEGKSVVSARELYFSLGYSQSQYSRWTKQCIVENAFFEENVDWQKLDTNVEAVNQYGATKDYALTITTAKKLAMMAKTEVGNKIRDYFIECEKKAISAAPKLPQSFAQALRLAAEQQELIEMQSQQLLENKPKVTYYDNVLASTSTVTTTIIAKDYGLTAQQMNSKLQELGIQYKQGGTWLLYKEHASMGYTQSETFPYQKTDETTGTRMLTKWTQKGRLFLYDLLKQNGILPMIER
ncbi:MAG: hypothetical protein GY755_13540 [Chloroflexi bacterium]|nr:hypothetical protein [Chloroflexota bacterium]